MYTSHYDYIPYKDIKYIALVRKVLVCGTKKKENAYPLTTSFYIIIVLARSVSFHLADVHLKISVKIQRRDKYIEDRAVVDRNKNDSTTYKRSIVSSLRVPEEQTKGKTIPLNVLTLQSCLTKESSPNNYQYSAISIL